MFKIACRNILRNKRRSLMCLLISMVGVAVLYLEIGYNTATNDGLKLMSVEQYGDLQIARKGHWDAEKTEQLLLSKNEMESIEKILRDEEAISGFTTQLNCSGILGTEDGSVIVSGWGIEPGNNLGLSYSITSGLNLFPGDQNLVLLGEGVEKKLHVQTEDWVSMMVTTLDGAYNSGSLQVSGTFTTGISELDGFYVILPLTYVQTLLNTDGVEKFVVRLKDTALAPEVKTRLLARFTAAGLELEIKSWSDLAVMYHQVKGMFETIFYFLSLIVFVLVFFSILEIMSMAFFERMNEIGTIRSIGAKRRQVFFLLIQEGLVQGITGGILGLCLGWGMGALINSLQISYVPPSFSDPVPLVINQSVGNVLLPFCIVLCSTILSAFFPAIKGVKLNIVEIMRHI
ncbi:MAG TPA: FtsX-like permease family protein [Bacillota bacterium]